MTLSFLAFALTLACVLHGLANIPGKLKCDMQIVVTVRDVKNTFFSRFKTFLSFFLFFCGQ